MPTPMNPLGVVLAGGESRRFGRDKALAEVEGESLVRRAVDLLQRVCPEVVLADRGQGLVPGIRSVADGPGAGPGAGLLGVANTFPKRPLLVLACDLPSVPVSLLRALVKAFDANGGEASWVPRPDTGAVQRAEPLCACYRPQELAVLEQRLEAGDLALQGWLRDPRCRIRFLEGEDLLWHGEPQEVFFNLNRPQDLDRWSASSKKN
ncbi:MAG: molybdenum cofactor guanylyltransferase [Acidobacteria bacterium]|nr:molybdenum cofactor guanylyltransferase [Acidobacteriota bacterium]